MLGNANLCLHAGAVHTNMCHTKSPFVQEKRMWLSFGYRPYSSAKGGIIFCYNSAAWPEAGLPWLDEAQRSIFQVVCTQA